MATAAAVCAATEELELAHSSRAASGFKGVQKTTSGKWQARAYLGKRDEKQRDLGSFDSPEEAARALAKWHRDRPGWSGPPKKRAARDTVRASPPLRMPRAHPAPHR